MTLNHRHRLTDRKLNKLAQKHINGNTLRTEAARLGKKYDVSGQTIINYIYGQGKDGFLKEALISELAAQ